MFLASDTVQGYRKGLSLRRNAQDFAWAQRSFNVNAKRHITLHKITYQYIYIYNLLQQIEITLIKKLKLAFCQNSLFVLLLSRSQIYILNINNKASPVMAMKLGLEMKDGNVLAVHLGLSERKYQSIFDKKRLLAEGIIILKWPLKKQWQDSCGLRWRRVANSYKLYNKVYGSIKGGEHSEQLNG